MEEAEEFEAIEKLETLGVNRGTEVCMRCSVSRLATSAGWPCMSARKHRSCCRMQLVYR